LSGQQQWREPLRNSMDWLRDKLSEEYEKKLSEYCEDPWRVRNDYIRVINDRSDDNADNFVAGETGRELVYEDKVRFLKLMEMQRMAMLMYTSCGWFFDNISGIEAVLVMKYATRGMQLYEELTKVDLTGEFESMLKEAPANVDHLRNGQEVYDAYVKPSQIDLHRVGAHFALSSIFAESSDQEHEVYCYTATMEDYKYAKAGSQILATGRALIRSNIIQEKQSVDFATLHMGGHNLFTALTRPLLDKEFHQMQKDLEDAFYRGDTNGVLRQINMRFGGNNYSIWHLFKDEQRRLVYELLSDTWEEIERSFRHVYQQNFSIMLMLRNMNMNLPKALSAPAEFIVNHDLCEVIRAEKMDVDRLADLTDEAARLSLQLDKTTLRYEASAKINRLMEVFEKSRADTDLLSTIERALSILKDIVPDMDLQSAQNLLFTIGKEEYTEVKEKASAQDEDSTKWVELFGSVAGHLGLVVE
jgi:hypothetical protein